MRPLSLLLLLTLQVSSQEEGRCTGKDRSLNLDDAVCVPLPSRHPNAASGTGSAEPLMGTPTPSQASTSAPDRPPQPLSSAFHTPTGGSLEWALQVLLTSPRETHLSLPSVLHPTPPLPSLMLQSVFHLLPSPGERLWRLCLTLAPGPWDVPGPPGLPAARESQASVQRVSCLSPLLTRPPPWSPHGIPLEPNSLISHLQNPSPH